MPISVRRLRVHASSRSDATVITEAALRKKHQASDRGLKIEARLPINILGTNWFFYFSRASGMTHLGSRGTPPRPIGTPLPMPLRDPLPD